MTRPPRAVADALAELQQVARDQLGTYALQTSTLGELLDVDPPTGPAAARLVIVTVEHAPDGTTVDPDLELRARTVLEGDA